MFILPNFLLSFLTFIYILIYVSFTFLYIYIHYLYIYIYIYIYLYLIVFNILFLYVYIFIYSFFFTYTYIFSIAIFIYIYLIRFLSSVYARVTRSYASLICMYTHIHARSSVHLVTSYFSRYRALFLFFFSFFNTYASRSFVYFLYTCAFIRHRFVCVCVYI